MLRFECDYTEGCIPEILDAIAHENHTQLQGYSEDTVCDRARAKIKALCGREDVDVHFLVGGTQANTTVIAAALRPYQGVISAATGSGIPTGSSRQTSSISFSTLSLSIWAT